MRTNSLRVSRRLGSVLLATILAWTALTAPGQEVAAKPQADCSDRIHAVLAI